MGASPSIDGGLAQHLQTPHGRAEQGPELACFLSISVWHTDPAPPQEWVSTMPVGSLHVPENPLVTGHFLISMGSHQVISKSDGTSSLK